MRHISRVNGESSITETRSRETTDYINVLTLTVRTAESVHDVAGSVVGNRALRLIRIDGYPIEATPDGYFLMLHNRDVPGVVGAVGQFTRAGRNQHRGLGAGTRSDWRDGAQPGGSRWAGAQ